MFRTNGPLQNQFILAADSDTESDDMSKYFSTPARLPKPKGKSIEQETTGQCVSEWKEDLENLLRRAQIYQDHMKGIQIPTVRGSIIPFNTWQGLAKSLKQLYKQPLHYLTNVQLKQWDKARINTEEEHMPMDNLVHPAKAEATIWLIEEIHRNNTAHDFLARLWLNDPMYHASVDPFYL